MIQSEKELDVYLSAIQPLDEAAMVQAQKKLNNLTKPTGSLGRLESLARRICGIKGGLDVHVDQKVILTFAADHGVVEEGVSSFPQEVTAQMVLNFLSGGAGVNVLARHVGAEVKVVDVGVKTPVSGEGLIARNVKPGTDNMAKGPAMSIDEALAAISVGIETAEQAIGEGANILGTGDMGIGNTTPSAALLAALLLAPVDDVTGRGTGIEDAVLAHKKEVISKAIEVNREKMTSPLSTLAALGGLEIAAICGVVLAGAKNRVPVVVDGFISSAGSLVAMLMNENVRDYCFFSHMSAEKGHEVFLEKMDIAPLLHLDLRLGEGTGAALGMGIIEAGVKILNEMATFGEAGVSEGT